MSEKTKYAKEILEYYDERSQTIKINNNFIT